jgi:hypothetical protein
MANGREVDEMGWRIRLYVYRIYRLPDFAIGIAGSVAAGAPRRQVDGWLYLAFTYSCSQYHEIREVFNLVIVYSRLAE